MVIQSLTISKKKREMKKIFYILASAIVALGAVACENEGMENIAPEVNGDTVSFVANIDNTKTDLDGLQTIWTAGDEITVVWNEKEYTFNNSEENVNVFTCTAEGLSAIKGQPVVAWYNKNGVDSSAGTAGAQLYATGSFGELLSFQIQSAFLKFTTKGQFETAPFIQADENLFRMNDTDSNKFEVTGTAKSVKTYYVAVKPGTYTNFCYDVKGNKKTKASYTIEAGKIYNLGTLKGEANAKWALVGQHQNWTLGNTTTPLYEVGDGLWVAEGLKLSNTGFKFTPPSNTSNWDLTFGVHSSSYVYNTSDGWYAGIYSNNRGDKTNDIKVSDWNKTYDIYLRYPNSGTWGEELAFTIVETGANYKAY